MQTHLSRHNQIPCYSALRPDFLPEPSSIVFVLKNVLHAVRLRLARPAIYLPHKFQPQLKRSRWLRTSPFPSILIQSRHFVPHFLPVCHVHYPGPRCFPFHSRSVYHTLRHSAVPVPKLFHPDRPGFLIPVLLFPGIRKIKLNVFLLHVQFLRDLPYGVPPLPEVVDSNTLFASPKSFRNQNLPHLYGIGSAYPRRFIHGVRTPVHFHHPIIEQLVHFTPPLQQEITIIFSLLQPYFLTHKQSCPRWMIPHS